MKTLIEAAFDDRDNIGVDTQGDVRDAVNATLEALDNGSLRVAEREGVGQWRVNQWAKKAVLLGFRLNDMAVMDGACGGAPGWDKVRLKTHGWGRSVSAKPVSAPCQGRSCATQPTSPRASC